jgi:hypothetical protein
MIHRKAVRVFFAAMVAALVFGCSDNTPDVGPSAGFLLVTPLFAGVKQGATKQLTATLNGTAIPVTWASSDATVATVSANGVVTAVAPGPCVSNVCGRAAITAALQSDPTQMRSASITVTP